MLVSSTHASPSPCAHSQGHLAGRRPRTSILCHLFISFFLVLLPFMVQGFLQVPHQPSMAQAGPPHPLGPSRALSPAFCQACFHEHNHKDGGRKTRRPGMPVLHFPGSCGCNAALQPVLNALGPYFPHTDEDTPDREGSPDVPEAVDESFDEVEEVLAPTDASSAILINFFRGYKRYISPLLPQACRFFPTCSEYAIESVQKFGPAKGAVLTAWRLLRCNPLGGRGWDPPQWPPPGWKAGGTGR